MELLPAELLAAGVLSRLDARSLGRVACVSVAIHKLAIADEAWRPLLLKQGLTESGLALWQRQQLQPSLMQLFAFADRYHEALEFEVLSYKKMPRRADGAFHACLEFANPCVFNTRLLLMILC